MLRPQHVKMNLPTPKLGDMIQVYESGTGVYRGYIFKLNVASNSDIEKILCYDRGIYLSKNSISKAWKNASPEQITKEIASMFGMKTNIIANTGDRAEKYAANCQSLYKIIMENYDRVSNKNGKHYYIYFENDNLNVLEQGSHNAGPLFNENNINNLTIDKTIENMVNRVVVYDDANGVVATAENKDWQKVYGVMQEAITKEKDKDNNALAKGKLNGIEHTIKLDTLGNVNCKTGYTVNVSFDNFGLKSKLYITEDKHEWKDGLYTMSLTLSFKSGGSN